MRTAKTYMSRRCASRAERGQPKCGTGSARLFSIARDEVALQPRAQSRIAAAGLTREARIAGKNPPSNPISEAKAKDTNMICGVGVK